jgi:hypothetical protein
MIKNKLELQKIIMLNSDDWWNVNDLTDVIRDRCESYGFKSINHATVERNIRHYREAKHFLFVEKRKTSDNTWEYKISSRKPYQESTPQQYAARK